MTERAEDLQSEALRAFTLLSALRQEWGGALIVACGLGPGGQGLSIAGNIAGAGCLLIDERADVCRAAMRSGACDFVVNTVDEALRVLKNEIRQRRPVSVGLTLGAGAALEELVDCGVLPELFTAIGGDAAIVGAGARAFAEMGARVVDWDGSLKDGGLHGPAILDGYVAERGLRLEEFSFALGEELRGFDARVAQVISAGDRRLRWCGGAPRFFHRERPYRRVVYLTAAERDAVAGA
jgi:hypothetical protein